ncbi:hypothetical protein J6590_002396 [Homalodisca vitripennis]|nr:hypothetical protein J6590_002396 [Homalodisca vitripennis]
MQVGRCLNKNENSSFVADTLNSLFASWNNRDTKGEPPITVPEDMSCVRCRKVFTIKGNLRRHVLYECGQPPRYKCELCGTTTTRRNTLRRHKPCDGIAVYHTCPRCPKQFKYKNNMMRHLRLECHKEPSFTCDSCARRFTQKSSLIRHQCPKVYKHKKHLQRHLKYECGISPQFACSVCNRQFKYKDKLSRHVLCVHGAVIVAAETESFIGWKLDSTGEEGPTARFICPQCQKMYKNKGHLARHLKFECGKDPKFECSICQKPFKRKDLLNRHFANVHSEEYLKMLP